MSADTDPLGERVAAIEGTVGQMNERLGGIEARLDTMNGRLETIDGNVDDVDKKIDRRIGEAQRQTQRWLLILGGAITAILGIIQILVAIFL